jgi:hypothetical protein
MSELLLIIHGGNKKKRNSFSKCGGKTVLLHILTVCLKARVKDRQQTDGGQTDNIERQHTIDSKIYMQRDNMLSKDRKFKTQMDGWVDAWKRTTMST